MTLTVLTSIGQILSKMHINLELVGFSLIIRMGYLFWGETVKQMMSACERDTHTPMFLAVLFITIKMENQPRCSSIDKEKVAYTHYGILLNHKTE